MAAWTIGTAHSAEPAAKNPSPAALEFFEDEIRPALVKNCLLCHSGERPQGNLRLDFRGGWEQGGKSGPAILPGDPHGSLLIQAIRHEGSTTPMPLGATLDPEVIKAFEEWVRMGAPDPRDTPSTEPAAEPSWEETFKQRSRWWSLQQVKRPPFPEVQQTEWSDHPIDRFILAKLEAKGLAPSPRAHRSILLRRLSFVLTGLPPKPEEIGAFVSDPDPGAYARAVDRLLSSPHFGERWARHWMDVVRYSDTYGYEWDIPAKGAWRYRDYLVRAFNNDVAFDQLVREQIAGDLLPNARLNPVKQINESLIGPMFFQMGEKRHGDSLQFNGIHQEMLDNKIDAFSKAFQGMTLACARCHDHKFDAISQEDYYALAGVFMSSRWVTNTLDTPERNRDVLDQLAALKPKIHKAVAAWWLEDAQDIPRYLRAAQACVHGDGNAAELAAEADEHRLAAWERALNFDLSLEDPLYAWFELNRSVKQGETVEEVWRRLAEEYEKASRERAETNAREFPVIADFRKAVPEGWSVDGVGLRRGPVSNGDFTVALGGSQAVGMLLPAGLFTHALSPRLNGAVRTPYLNLSGKPYISVQVSGGDFSSYRTVVDNAFLTERQVYLKENLPHWVRLSTTAEEKTNRRQTEKENAETRIYVELATKTSNPNFPPRVNLGGKCTEEQTRDPRSWFGIARAVLHEKDASPSDELTRFRSLFEGDVPSDLFGVASRYRDWLSASLETWAEDRAGEDDVRLINWMLDKRLLPNRMEERRSVGELVSAYREIEKQIEVPETVNGMADLDPGRDYRLNIRGVYEDLGDRVPRGYVEVIDGWREESEPARSGRLEVAELVASRENPLTARVFVNRVWHWVFGTGIVKTTNDFGHLGDRPSHRELLDYLADWFVNNGWSVKKLVRTMVISETFQQSSEISASGKKLDPSNRLLHRYPMQRLDAEAIRDSLLAVSGRLDYRLFGALIDPYRMNEDPEKRLFSGPLDGNGRRSIYLKMTIMEPPKLLATFNQPRPKIPTGRRDVTNVPGQALVLLNSPFVAEQAKLWAQKLVETPHDSPEARLTDMFRRALGRDANPQELERWTDAVNDIAGLYQGIPDMRPPPGGLMHSTAVWQSVAHAMLNTKEFLYVR